MTRKKILCHYALCLSFYLWNICFMPLLNHNNSVYFCIITFYTTLLFTLKNVLPLEAHKGHWMQNYYHSQCFLIVFENFLIPHNMKNPWSPLDLKVIQKKCMLLPNIKTQSIWPALQYSNLNKQLFVLTAILILRRNILMVISNYLIFLRTKCKTQSECTGFRPSLKQLRSNYKKEQKIKVCSLTCFGNLHVLPVPKS